MNDTPAGRIRRLYLSRTQGFQLEKLREAGCEDREIEAIASMSTAMITRYSRFADQRRLAKVAIHRLERTGQAR